MLNQDDSGKVSGSKPARLAKYGRQGERTDPAVLDYIANAVFRQPNVKAAQVIKELAADPHLAPLRPMDRTVRGHVAAARDRLDKEVWSPVGADDDEARWVLPVLGRLQRPEHIGPDFTVTPRVAKWIARIRRWIDADSSDLRLGAGNYLLPAVWYADRIERAAPTDDLDRIIAKQAADKAQGPPAGD